MLGSYSQFVENLPMEDKELCIHMVTTMAADDLAMHGTRPSADMVLTQLSHNVQVSRPENWILQMLNCFK